MTSDNDSYKERFNIFHYYNNNKISVVRLCNIFSKSRTWFYKWQRRFNKYGIDGLKDVKRKINVIPNKTTVNIEICLLNYIVIYPTYGPIRISNQLFKQNVYIKCSAVYNVLKRKDLNKAKQRLEYSRIRNNVVKTIAEIEKAKELSKRHSLNTLYPGDIVGIDVFYVGTLKGIGRIYQFTGIDTYSSYAWCKLYLDKSAISACDFMMHIYNNNLCIPIKSVLTDNGKEFTTHHDTDNHSFKRLLNELNIGHRFTKVRHPWTNGSCERLNRTIIDEFYKVVFIKKIYDSVDELYKDLSEFIEFYNCQRTHQGKRNKGNFPIELYLLHLYTNDKK